MRSIAVLFLIVACVYGDSSTDNGILPVLEEKFENKLTEYAGGVTRWLESFNDEHLGNTELGRFLHYNAIKTKLEENAKDAKEAGSQSRGMKKMGMTMMPLIFHIGATSTWMLITTVLAAKSLAVGLMLLIFKIAVSSAKLAAFFTHLKSKHSDHGHHEWAWTPHYEHHDHHSEHHPEHHGTISHLPEWTPNDIPVIPHNIHEYRNNEIHDFKPHEFHEYKTIPSHAEIPILQGIDMQMHGLNSINPMNGIHEIHSFDGFQNDMMGFNHFEGAKKKIDTKVG